MSAAASTSVPALGPLATASEPAWVRKGGASVQQDYRAALAFESLLVQQLTRSMSETTGAGGEDGEGAGGEAATGLLGSMLPGALAEGVTSAGGLGLAAQLTAELTGGPATHPAPGQGAQAPTASHARTPAEAATGGASA